MPNNLKPKVEWGRHSGGRPVDIPARLAQYDVALRFCVGYDHAARLLQESSAVALLGEERVKDLTKWGMGKDAELYLYLMRESYDEQRREGGFKT